MDHLDRHHEKVPIEESGIAPDSVEARGCPTIRKQAELKELEKTYLLARRKIAPELTGVFLGELDVCEVETISRWGLVATCHASRKVVAS